MMQRNTLIGLAAGGSLALLLTAFAFQHLGGLAPCKLCLWQRWPHVAAVAVGIAAIVIRGRLLPALGMVAALTTAAIGLYHTGVERGWWQGPTTCSATPSTGLSDADLFDQIVNAPVIRCDEVVWQVASLSMASWNALAALALAALWYLALRKS